MRMNGLGHDEKRDNSSCGLMAAAYLIAATAETVRTSISLLLASCQIRRMVGGDSVQFGFRQAVVPGHPIHRGCLVERCGGFSHSVHTCC
jgi:hypothetical protein